MSGAISGLYPPSTLRRLLHSGDWLRDTAWLCRTLGIAGPYIEVISRISLRSSGDIAPERRKLARQFGAAEVIDPAAHDMVAAIAELTHGEGAHKTLDASSAPDARAAAVRSVRAWGTACFVGERGQVTLDVSADLLRRQVTLVGSWTFSKQGQAECAEFIAERKVDVERLFTHRWRLEQAEEAYRLFDTQTTGKAVILPS